MSPKKNIPNRIPPNPENPFRVPDGYFENVQQRVMERIRAGVETPGKKSSIPESESGLSATAKKAYLQKQAATSEQGQKQAATSEQAKKQETERSHEQPGDSAGKKVTRGKKIYLQPYISLAAVIAGVALVVYIVLQSVISNRSGNEMYDIATLDKTGIIQDESVLAETFAGEDEESVYTEWDEEAIVYLASNEVDLLDLLDTN